MAPWNLRRMEERGAGGGVSLKSCILFARSVVGGEAVEGVNHVRGVDPMKSPAIQVTGSQEATPTGDGLLQKRHSISGTFMKELCLININS